MSMRCQGKPFALALLPLLLGAAVLPACEREVLLGYLSQTAGPIDAASDSSRADDPLQFRRAQPLALAAEPRAIRSADLNHDGLLDLIVAHGAAKVVRSFLGRGDGTFPRTVDTPCSDAVVAMVVADFNGDQQPDLAVILGNQGLVQILAGRGDGSFSAARTYATGSGALAAAELNGDGRPDLAVATASEVVVLLSGPLGVGFEPLTAARYPLPGAASALAAADLNRDGSPELAVALGSRPAIAVLRNNGSGGFSLGSATLVEPAQNIALVALDRSQPPQGAVTGASTLTLLTNQDGLLIEDGKLGIRYPIGSDPVALDSLDLDRDGHLDLLTASASQPTLSVWFGSGSSNLRRPGSTIPLPAPATGLGIGDWNQDTRVDLAAISATPPQLYILLGGAQP